MNWDADVVREGPVIQHVDAEVHGGDVAPFSNRNVWLPEVVLSSRRDLTRVCGQ